MGKRDTVEIEVKKSRFIANVSSENTEQGALEFIDYIKNKHKDATHNVYGYSIGTGSEVQRFDDDGEPSGTAGIPVLEVIKNMQLKNVVVVVTRYFGGTLLGAGGLIRAYSKSAKLGIEKCGIIKKVQAQKINFTTDYSFLGKVENYLKSNDISIFNIDYKDSVALECGIKKEMLKKVISEIKDITNNKVSIEVIEDIYIDIPMG